MLPSDFPSRAVYDAYSNPAVEKQTGDFEWKHPDLEFLKSYPFQVNLISMFVSLKALLESGTFHATCPLRTTCNCCKINCHAKLYFFQNLNFLYQDAWRFVL